MKNTKTFLKQQIDYNYEQYRQQKISMAYRKYELEKNIKDAFIIWLIEPAICIISIGISYFLAGNMYIGGKVILNIFKCLSGFLLAVGLILMVISIIWIPVGLKNVMDYVHRYEVLTGHTLPDFIHIKSDTVTFNMEKKFLEERISEIEKFNEKYDKLCDSGSENPEDDNCEIADEMIGLSIFREYRADESVVFHDDMIRFIQIFFGILIFLLLYGVAKTFLPR